MLMLRNQEDVDGSIISGSCDAHAMTNDALFTNDTKPYKALSFFLFYLQIH